MPEIENIEQIVGHGTPKVDAVIPGVVSGGTLLGFAVGLSLFSIKPSRDSVKFVRNATFVGSAVSFPTNWIYMKIWDMIDLPKRTLQNKETVAHGAPKVNAVIPDWRAAIGVDSGTLLGYLTGLTPRANIVIPDWRGATLVGAFLGSSVGRLIGELPSTRKNAQDLLKLFDELPMVKMNPILKERIHSKAHNGFSKLIPRVYGSLCGGIMGGVFGGTYCGLHNCLAMKRGVEDGYNHLVASCLTSAILGFLYEGSSRNRIIITRNCIITMMTPLVAGCAIASVHLKKVD